MIDMLGTLWSGSSVLTLGIIAIGLVLMFVFRDPLWSLVAAVAQLGIWIGGILLFTAAIIVTAEVLLRKSTSLVGTGFVFSGSDELSGYLFAVGTSLSMAYVLLNRGHVRIDVLYSQLGPRTRAILDVIALIVLAIFVSAMLERAIDVASTSYFEKIRSNTNLRIPLAWSQIPWAFGIALFFVAILLALFRSVVALVRGDFPEVSAIAGVATSEEEIEAEIRGLNMGGDRKSQSGA